MPIRTTREPRVRMVTHNFDIPAPLYYSLKVECARRGLPLRSVFLQAVEIWLRDSVAYREFLNDQVRRFPRLVGKGSPSPLGPTAKIALQEDRLKREKEKEQQRGGQRG